MKKKKSLKRKKMKKKMKNEKKDEEEREEDEEKNEMMKKIKKCWQFSNARIGSKIVPRDNFSHSVNSLSTHRHN